MPRLLHPPRNATLNVDVLTHSAMLTEDRSIIELPFPLPGLAPRYREDSFETAAPTSKSD